MRVASDQVSHHPAGDWLVARRRDHKAIFAWWSHCIQRAIPCLWILERGQVAEVKLDAFTTKRQSFVPKAATELRQVVEGWEGRLAGPRGSWDGPVCFGVDKVPSARAAYLAIDLLEALQRTDPGALERMPRGRKATSQRLGFLRYYKQISKSRQPA